MGKMDGFNIRFRKTIGGLTFYKVKDETIVRQKRTKPATPDRYFPQMVQRAKAANMNRFYAATDNLLKEAFELDKPTSNAHAMFSKMNWAKSTVYLTKEECEKGTVILFPYCVSYGTLDNPVGITTLDDKQVTDICLGDLTIDSSTTVSQLASAILDNNGNRFDTSSRITFVRATQLPEQGDVPPSVTFQSHSINLKVTDQHYTVWGHLGTEDGFLSVPVARDGVTRNYLACSKVQYSMVAWTHSKLGNDHKTVLITTQYLTGDNPLLARYQTDIALYYAILSLGGVNKENHYSPNYMSWKDFEKKVQKQIAGLAPDHSGSTGGGTGNTDPTSPQMAQIVVDAFPDGAHDRVSGGGEYEVGSTVTLTATSTSKWQFIRWQQQGGGTFTTPTIEITVPAGGATYTAHFENAE